MDLINIIELFITKTPNYNSNKDVLDKKIIEMKKNYKF